MSLSLQGKQCLYRPIRVAVSQQAITCTNHGTALIPTQLYLQLQSISKKGRQSPSIKGSTDYRLHQCEREGIEPPVLALVSRRESNLYPSCHWTEIAAAPPRVAQQPKGVPPPPAPTTTNVMDRNFPLNWKSERSPRAPLVSSLHLRDTTFADFYCRT